MRKIFLFTFAFLILQSCENSKIEPTSIEKILGNYSTNATLDPVCAILPTDKMPFVTITKTDSNLVSVKITRFIDIDQSLNFKKTETVYEKISVSKDNRGIVLTYKSTEFGYYGTPLSYTGKDDVTALWIKHEDKDTKINEYFVGKKD